MDANTERFSFVSFSANWPIVLLTLLCIRRTTESPWDITQNSSITRLDTSSISSFQSATHKNRFNGRSAFASSLNKPQKTHIESASVVGAPRSICINVSALPERMSREQGIDVLLDAPVFLLPIIKARRAGFAKVRTEGSSNFCVQKTGGKIVQHNPACIPLN